VPSIDEVQARLRDWSLTPPVDLAPLAGGINSHTWAVHTGRGDFVAKAAHPSHFLGGLEIAALLEARGFRAGSALPTRDGTTVVRLEGENGLALLRLVPGRPLDRANAADRLLIARALGDVHSLLLREKPPTALARWPWRWLTDFAQVRLPRAAEAAIVKAVHDAEILAQDRRLTHGILHGDVAGSDFLFDDRTNTTGLVDWGAAMHGPLLYDLGSFCALGRLGRTDREAFLGAYLGRGPLLQQELEALDAFITFRWAVQAHYFGWRIAQGVMTGIADSRGNEEGLRDSFEGLGLA
jgi:homoserine kinase type II